MRRRLADIVDEVARTSAAQPGEPRAFFATGVLLNMTAALEPAAEDDSSGRSSRA